MENHCEQEMKYSFSTIQVHNRNVVDLFIICSLSVRLLFYSPPYRCPSQKKFSNGLEVKLDIKARDLFMCLCIAVIGVHIPVEGEFTADACKESYRRAKAVFARFFPELDVKGFVCYPG